MRYVGMMLIGIMLGAFIINSLADDLRSDMMNISAQRNEILHGFK